MAIYVGTDFHGVGEIWDQVKNFLQENDKLIYLGDACDRGHDGYRIMKEMLEDERVIYLQGNHEAMFVDAAREFISIAQEEGYSPTEWARANSYQAETVVFGGSDMVMHWRNGGSYTLEAWMKDGCPTKILRALTSLPVNYTARVTNEQGEITGIYDLCHAGCIEAEWEDKDTDSLLWDRSHFNALWQYKDNEDEMDHVLIHGHTPIPYMETILLEEFDEEQLYQPLRYARGTKINLDVLTIQSGVTWLMNLETGKFHKIDKNKTE